jgi:hypothetical protein
MDTSNLDDKQKEYINLMHDKILAQKWIMSQGGMNFMGGMGAPMGGFGGMGGTGAPLGGMSGMGGMSSMGGIGGDVYARVSFCRQCWASKCRGL